MWWKTLILIIVLTALFFVLGLFAGGATYLMLTGNDYHQTSFNTLLMAGDFSLTSRQKIYLPWAWCVTAALTFLPTGMMLLMLFGGKKNQNNLHGNARFANGRELESLEYRGSWMYTKRGKGKEVNIYDPEKMPKYSPENKQKRVEVFPPIILGKHPTKKDTFLASYGQTFAMLAAPPGSGKLISALAPNMMMYPGSVVCNDPKFEIWNLTAGFRAHCGQKVYRFSPELLESHRWNPLSRLSRDELYRLGDVKEIASVIYTPDNPKNASFFGQAANICQGIILYLIENEKRNDRKPLPTTLPQVYEIAALGDGIASWAQEALDASDSGTFMLSDETCRELNVIKNAPASKNGWPTVKDILINRLSTYAEKTVAWAVSGDDIDFDMLRQEPTSVYFCVTQGAVEKFAPLMNLFYSQIIRVNGKVLPEQGGWKDDGTLKYGTQLLIAIDEVAVMGRIDALKTAPALMRGAGLRFLLSFQGKKQLQADELYGVQGADAIMEAIHMEIVYAPGNIDAAEEYSKRLGNTTVSVYSHSETKGKTGSRSRNRTLQARALMLPQEINALPYEEELLFLQPSITTPALQVRTKKIYWFKEKVLEERANMPLPPIPTGDRDKITALVEPMRRKTKQGVEIASPQVDEMREEQEKRSLPIIDVHEPTSDFMLSKKVIEK